MCRLEIMACRVRSGEFDNVDDSANIIDTDTIHKYFVSAAKFDFDSTTREIGQISAAKYKLRARADEQAKLFPQLEAEIKERRARLRSLARQHNGRIRI